MAISEIIELFDSGAATKTRNDDGSISKQVTLRWLIPDQSSYKSAQERLELQAPAVWDEHFRQSLDVQPLGNKWWIGSAVYVAPALMDGDGTEDGQIENLFPASVSFDTTGGTEHITQAFYDGDGDWGGEATFAGEGVFPPSYEGAINVSGGQVNGIDVVSPVFNFTETWTMPTQFLTADYIASLYDLTGKTNETEFRIFKRGECLFMGARSELQRGDFRAAVTFSFSARPTEIGKKVGRITIPNKEGWQYVWVQYEDSVDNANLIKKPKYAYLNDIYGKGDFGRLGIGSDFPRLYRPAPTGPAL
jgi:hypothetical protein